jgi:hypothetical protein
VVDVIFLRVWLAALISWLDRQPRAPSRQLPSGYLHKAEAHVIGARAAFAFAPRANHVA